MRFPFRLTTLVSLLYLCSLASVKGQPGYTWLNPKRLWHIQDAWALSDSSWIGTTWYNGIVKGARRNSSVEYLNDSSRLTAPRSIWMLDNQVGVGIHPEGKALRTTDGGRTWSVILQNPTQTFDCLNFDSPTRGAFIGRVAWDSAPNYGYIYRTFDRGLTWKRARILISRYGYGSAAYLYGFRGLSFGSAKFGVASENSQLSYMTQDSGRTWQRYYAPIGMRLNEGTCIGDSIIISRGSLSSDPSYQTPNRLFISYNRGRTWTMLSDRQTGTPQWMDGKLWMTTQFIASVSEDTGRTWRTILNTRSLPYLGNNINNLRAWRNRVTVVAGFRVFFSTDNGTTWDDPTQNMGMTDVTAMWFKSDHVFWVGADSGWVGRTTDGGRSWTKSRVGPDFTRVEMLQFLNDTIGYACTSQYLYRTNNGGISWTLYNTQGIAGAEFRPLSFRMLADSVGYLAKSNTVYKFGFRNVSNFSQSYAGFGGYGTNYHLKLVPIDSSYMFMCGDVPSLYSVRDHSVDLTDIYDRNGYTNIGNWSIRAAQFINPNKGFAISGGLLLEWMPTRRRFRIRDTLDMPGYQSDTDNQLYLADSLHMFVSSLQKIWESRDGGYTWAPYSNFGNSRIYCLEASPSGAMYVGGTHGTVIRYGDIAPPLPTPSKFLTGYAFLNLDSNCVQSSGERPMAGEVIRALPGPYYTITDTSGKFVLPVDSGVYTVTQLTPSAPGFRQTLICPGTGSYRVNFAGRPDTVKGVNFASEVSRCAILQVSLTTGRLRRCMHPSAQLKISNIGSVPTQGLVLRLNLGNLRLAEAGVPYSLAGDSGQILLDLQELAAFSHKTIPLTLRVPCTANWGEQACIHVEATASNSCRIARSGYDGSDLVVNGRCGPSGRRFVVYNRGLSMSAPRALKIYVDDQLVQVDNLRLTAGDSVGYNLRIRAEALARLEAYQDLAHPAERFAFAQLRCQGGTGVAGSETLPNDAGNMANRTFCDVIRAAVDPNDKQVSPPGLTADGYIPPLTPLTYTIRFQNTGNDTAFAVEIRDTLDQNLDISSLQMGAASHPYQVALHGKVKPILSITFPGIALPDSMVDREGSQGFVSFRITPVASITNNTPIVNRAEIIFDRSSSLLTPFVRNTVRDISSVNGGYRDSITIGNPIVSRLKRPMEAFRIFPNPNSGHFTLATTQGGLMHVSDLTGRVLLSRRVGSGENTLDLSMLGAGCYLVSLEGCKSMVFIE